MVPRAPISTSLFREPMRRPLLAVAIMLTLSSLTFPNLTTARRDLASEKAAGVHIVEGPALESATDNSAIIRWTTDNPGGSDLHYAVLHYGTDPKNLSQTAKSPNKRNRSHPSMIFRVRVDGLRPGTIYYFTVESVQATGTPDGVKSALNQFTTPQHH
jgi:Purple acid Phosphatase, N-terminal domain